MGRMRVSCVTSCGSCLVHISHLKCWLEEFTSVPWLHRPPCNPCCQPAFPDLLTPLKPLVPLLDLAGSYSAWTPTPPHISAALPCPPLWVLAFSETPPFSLTPLHLLLPLTAPSKLDPHLQQPQLPRLSATSKVPLRAPLQLSAAPYPLPHSIESPCWDLVGMVVVMC